MIRRFGAKQAEFPRILALLSRNRRQSVIAAPHVTRYPVLMEAVARNPEEALKPRRQMRIKPLRFKPFMAGEAWGDIMEPRPLGGRFRAIRRIISVLIWTLIAIPIQAVLMLLPGRLRRLQRPRRLRRPRHVRLLPMLRHLRRHLRLLPMRRQR